MGVTTDNKHDGLDLACRPYFVISWAVAKGLTGEIIAWLNVKSANQEICFFGNIKQE
jgi:hypothetical protein